MRYELDSNARRDPQGTALFGGSPFRLMRLSPAGARMLDAWLAGEPVEMSPEASALQQRLVAGGLIHPIVAPAEYADFGVVIPVYNDVDGLTLTLAAVRREFPTVPIVIVDDMSTEPDAVVAVAAAAAAEVVRHDLNQGPAAARNSGWRALPDTTTAVIFIDSDAVPAAGSLSVLLGHLADEAVAGVAPRIRARSGHSLLDRYEAVESPLDLGPSPANVRPGSSVPYVPSTMLVLRRSALDTVGGFDESLRVGEDVDLVWRVVRAGGVVRYEPAATAHHRNRSSWVALARQRHGYGTAAAALDRRHSGDVAPIELPPETLAAWALAVFGGAPGLIGGLALAGRDAASLRSRLVDRVENPERETMRLSAMSHAHAGHWLARAVTRAWWPFFLMASPLSRRARRATIAAVALPPLVSWWKERPPLDPVSYAIARTVDDAAYGAGLWSGMVAERSLRPLLPRLARRS